MRNARLVVAALALVLALPLAGVAAVPPDVIGKYTYTENLTPLGYSERNVPLDNNTPGAGSFNSDLAFWGNRAIQGTYAGFRIIDISSPENPTEIIDWEDCASRENTQGNQGDVIIWENLVIRSWNSPTPSGGSHCGDWPMAAGEEGVHVIDISNPTQPDVVAFVDTPCGSHTETLVPDLENNRLLVYSNSSANTIFGTPVPPDSPPTCRGIDIIEVPLDDPAAASYLRFEKTGHEDDPLDHLHSCHDTSVILGSANLVACAGQTSATGGNGITVFSLDPADGGSKEDPMFMYHKTTGGISLGHSASFSWDGETIIVGHEPGGGSGANCEATDNPLERTFFFVDAESGDSIGQFTLPRPQSNVENCTTHNFNVIPNARRDVMVSGNYQSGISVIDFSDPANASEIAFADPAPLVDPNPPVGIELGGDWSTYWYDGYIYESNITTGMLIWRLSARAVVGAVTLGHSNPQTQEFTLRSSPFPPRFAP